MCVLVTSGHLLDSSSVRGIKVEPTKIKAIIELPPLTDIREGLQGSLTYIRKFVLNLLRRCQPFSRQMKKDVVFEWDQ